MPHHASEEKALRKRERRTEVNRKRKGKIKSAIKRVEKAIELKDKTAALAALQLAESALMSGRSKGVIHINTAARKTSRLSKKVKDLPGEFIPPKKIVRKRKKVANKVSSTSQEGNNLPKKVAPKNTSKQNTDGMESKL